jgi:hypothetical protein
LAAGCPPVQVGSTAANGLQHLLGIGPFNAVDTRFDGIPVLKKPIKELDGTFDLIVFHHSFEQIAAQFTTLIKASSLLAKGGLCLLRIPLVDSELCERYGADWVELDAPRRFYRHSLDSIKRLAHAAGMIAKNVVFDSEEWDFLGSERYRQDIPMRNSRSWFVDKSERIFTIENVLSFEKEAQLINGAGRDDRVAFYFTKD